MSEAFDANREYPLTTWDIVWDPQASEGDFALSGQGLRAQDGIATAAIIQLFTDRRAPDDREVPNFMDGDRRGWYGDYANIHEEDYERPIGSLLWLYERSILSDDIAEAVRAEAEGCLQVLIEQGAVARIVVTETHNTVEGWLALDVRMYSQDGSIRYAQKFHRYWQQSYPQLS